MRFWEMRRELWDGEPLAWISADLCYALRGLRRSPGLAAAIIATLSLGIAASSVMFTLVDEILLRPLPYDNSGQLVEIKESGNKGPSRFGAPFLDLEQWRERSRSLKSIAFYTYAKPTYFLEGNTGPVEVNTPRVSLNLFRTLGVQSARGRVFDDREGDQFANSGETKTAVLSDVVWRDAFGRDPGILGRVVRVNGDSFTVIGVMPRGFEFPFNTEHPQIWIPVALSERDKVRIKNVEPEYGIIARLRTGVLPTTAKAELNVIQSEVARLYADAHARESVSAVELESYGDSIAAGKLRTGLFVLLAAASVLWLIACVNATSLFLSRGMAREREIAVRTALGASRSELVRQLLIEALVLSGAASLVGVLVATLMLKLSRQELTNQLPVHLDFAPNLVLISFLLGLTLLTALVSSLWPAWVAAKSSIEPLLRQGSLRTRGRAEHRSRGVLVGTEVAFSFALLVACGLFLRSLYSLRHVALGFRTDHVIVADMVIPAYKFDGRNMTTELYQPLVEKVERMPGVQAAALTTAVPLGKRFPILLSFAPDERGRNENADLTVQFRAVGPGLQRVLGFRMVAGRFFNQGDTPTSLPVVVVNRAFVRAFFGEDRDPLKVLGERMLGYGGGKPAQIVGVIDDERQASVSSSSTPELEVCIPQITPATGFYRVAEGMAMNLAVRTEKVPEILIPQLREVLRSASPELATSTFTTMQQVVDDSFGNQRDAARLLAIFAGSALLLCVVGLYGSLAYLVTQRTQELAIRQALGAGRRQVVWLVLRQAGWILVAGLVMGLALSLASTHVLASFLYGVKAYDRLTLAGASLILLGTGLAAAYIPAERAASVDPLEALRVE